MPFLPNPKGRLGIAEAKNSLWWSAGFCCRCVSIPMAPSLWSWVTLGWPLWWKAPYTPSAVHQLTWPQKSLRKPGKAPVVWGSTFSSEGKKVALLLLLCIMWLRGRWGRERLWACTLTLISETWLCASVCKSCGPGLSSHSWSWECGSSPQDCNQDWEKSGYLCPKGSSFIYMKWTVWCWKGPFCSHKGRYSGNVQGSGGNMVISPLLPPHTVFPQLWLEGGHLGGRRDHVHTPLWIPTFPKVSGPLWTVFEL